MSAPVLRIGHGHNESSLVDYVRYVQADLFGCNEVQLRLPDLRAIEGTRLTGAREGFTDLRNRARSSAIVTSDGRPSIGELTRKVSERLPAFEKIAPDRVLVASFYEHPVAGMVGAEGIAHFELHPDAGPRQLHDKNPDAPLAREYREALDSTRRFMQVAREDGLLVVLTGDLQVSARHDRGWGPRPQLARPLNLGARAVGIAGSSSTAVCN